MTTQTATAAEAPPRVDPEPIMRVATGFMAAKHLFVASDIGVFEALADGPLSLDDLAAALSIPRRTVRISADAMAALGLVERDDEGRYLNSRVAQQFLAGRAPTDLRPFLRFWDRLSYPMWNGLGSAISGEATRAVSFGSHENEIFAAGVEAITAGAAHALATVPELADRRRLLDLAGGTGSFLVPALEADDRLGATLWELPETADIARDRLAGTSVRDRIEIVGGDALEDSVPAGHDAILVANFAHLLPPERNIALLRRLREASEPGTLLLLVDFWTDATHTDPPAAALLAGEFLLVGGQGDVYSVEEVGAWLAETGWDAVEHRPLAGPQTLVLARA